MVSGHGYSSAKIMLIADGCTVEDVSKGKAITGYNEQIIRELCNKNHLNFNEFWKTALIKEKVNLIKPEANEEMVSEGYKMILTNEINEIQPNVIVPLSELSFRFVTGLKSIYKFRGSVLPTGNSNFKKQTRVIPVLGPNPYINSDYSTFYISQLDFGKVAKNQHLMGQIPEIGHTWIAKDSMQLRNFLNRQYYTAAYLVFDIETYCGIPTCISLCFDGNESVTVPFLDSRISLDARVLMLDQVAKVLASPIPKVNQNIKFDWKKCERFLLKVNNIVGDTTLAASCLFPEYPKNLGFLTSLYTDMPYFKDEGKQYDPTVHNRDRLYLYCAKDSLATHKIYSQQLEEMVIQGVKPVYDNIMKVFPLYKTMEDNGIRIDETRRLELRAKYVSLYNIQLFKFKTLANREDINPASPTQLRNFIYDELGYKPVRGVKRTKKGKPGTDEESLELLMWMGKSNTTLDGNEILRTAIALRKIHKVLEYIDTDLHLDNILRCEYNLGGTVNGRTSAGKTTDVLLQFKKKAVIYEDIGRSFQTIAKHGFELDGAELGKDLRSMFMPSVGYSFVECDLSQAEARVDAVLAKDFDILPVFDGPVGIHRLTGSWLYNCDPSEIKKSILVNGVDRYHQAKTARHGYERNMRADRLMMMMHQPIRECERILRACNEKQPNIRQVFHKEVDWHIKNHKMLRAPNGRMRQFFGRYSNDQVNEAISFLPQVIVSDQLKFSLDKTFKECDYARPILEAHDGFLAEVPIGREEEYALVFKENVETPIDFRKCSLSRDYELIIPMECEKSSTNWQELKGFKI